MDKITKQLKRERRITECSALSYRMIFTLTQSFLSFPLRYDPEFVLCFSFFDEFLKQVIL